MIKDAMYISSKAIRHRKVRSWLTIMGIIIGVAAIITLITVSEGLELAIQQQFESFGTSVIRVTAKGLRGPPTDSDIVTKKDVETIENIKGLEYIAPMILKNAKLEFNNQEVFNLVAGYPTEYADPGLDDLGIKIEKGRIFEKEERDVAIIGQVFADDAFNKEMVLKSNLLINEEKFRVIGIIKKTGVQNTDEGIYIPLEDAKEIFNTGDGYSIITAKVQEGLPVDPVKKEIEKKLKRARDNENFQVFTPEQIVAQLGALLIVVQFILVGIAGIALFVGAIGIMNAMFTSVLERTKDIGVMKAIGAKKNHILFIFLFEAGLFGLAGGILGCILGIAVSFGIKIIASQLGFSLLAIKIDPLLILFVILFAFLVGMIAGYLPSKRAANLKPVDTLRYE